MIKIPALEQQILRSGSVSLVSKASETALGLLLAVLLARLLGASGYGIYAFVFALVSMASVPVRMGIPPLIVRETARGHAEGDWGLIRGIWRWANIVTLGLSLLVVAAGMLGLWLGWVQKELRETLFLGFWLVPLLALAAIRSASLRGLRHVGAGILPEQVLRPAVMATLLVGVTAWSGHDLSPAGAMGLMVIAAVASFLVGAWFLHSYRPKAVQIAPPTIRQREWSRAAWPLALAEGFHQLNRYADVILLGLLATVADVGIYRVAAQGAVLVSLGLMALTVVVTPLFARFHTQHDYQKLEKLAQRAAQAALGLGIPAVVVFGIYGEWLLSTLFGAEYSDAYRPLVILSLGQLANAGFGATGPLLNMTGHEREVTRVVAIAAGLNVVLNVALIPLFGVEGAATATALTLVFWNAWLWRIVRVRLGIRCSAII